MKLSGILLFMAVMNIMATGYSQTTSLSLNVDRLPMRDLFKEIERQSDLSFIFNDDMSSLNEEVSINVHNANVRDVLNSVFKNSDLSYEILSNKLIVVAPKGVLQQTEVTGVITDSNGNPLVGANVVIKGTTVGVVTDVSGKFSIAIPNRDVVLVFSYIGYVSQELAVGDRKNINIQLVESNLDIEEVVVIGYGTVKKSDLTGSVTSVTSRAFIDQPGSAGNSILVGRAPGVVVRRANGAPDEESTLRIRGVNSILGNNDPLIVVDGNYSSMPSMYDIESIEILKDASATAIYGSRGANGVIIITTKRGSSEGKNEVKVYSNLSFAHIPQNWRFDMMNPKEYAAMANEMYMLRNPTLSPIYNIGELSDKGTDWQGELFRMGLSQNYKAVLSGGNSRMKYYITPTYNQVDGVIINSWAKSYGVAAKFDAELNKHISYQLEANVGHGDRYNPDLGRGTSHEYMPLCAALVWSPIPGVYNPDGTFVERDPLSTTVLNPVVLTSLKDTRYTNNGSLVGNVKVKIIDGLVFDGKAYISFNTGGIRYFRPGVFYSGRADARQTSFEDRTWLLNAVLTYAKTFNERHNMSLMFGFEETQSHSRSFNADANDLSIHSVEWDNLSLGRVISMGSGYGNSALRSYFTRATYNYDRRYYFTGTWRADGSSKFQGDNRFSYFPSLGVAWNLSEEGFMKDWGAFQHLKFRATWGITGSQAVSSYATYSNMGRASYTWGTNTLFTGYHPGAPTNPNLQWEATTSKDLGLDITTLNGKLTLAVDWYYKKTDKLLSKESVPIYNGGGSVYTNIGSIENKGFEVNLNYQIFESRNWSYDVNANISRNRNKVLDIGEQERLWGSTDVAGVLASTPFIIMPGHPIGTIYGYKYMGIWQQNEAAEAAKYGYEPGYYRYDDLNESNIYDAGDYQVIGCASPKFTWGFNNHLSWKNWDLNVLVEGLHGRDVLNLTYMLTTDTYDNAKTVTSREGRDRWTPENPNAKFGTLKQLAQFIRPNSDQWIQDGSYVKIRNVSLAYRFSKKMIKIADARLAFSAQNLFTFTKYKGYDPEVSSAGGSDTDAGLDWFAYPNPRSYTISLSVDF